MLHVGLVSGLKPVASATAAPCPISSRAGALQMIGADGPQFDRQARGPGVRELVGVDLEPETQTPRGFQIAAGVFERESALTAAHTGKTGEFPPRYMGEHFGQDPVDVLVSAALKLGREGAGAEIGGDNIERCAGQLGQHPQRLHFSAPVQTVAGLSLERSSAVPDERVQ